MRLLIVSPSLPHPHASHGGGVYLGALLEALARRAEVSLTCFVKPSEVRWGCEPPAGLASFHSVSLPQQVDRSTAERLRHKAQMLSSWGLARRPLLAAKHWSNEMTRTLATLNRDSRPDVVLVEFAVMAQYLPLFADVPTVFTDHESGEPLPGDIGPFGLGRQRDRRLWEDYVRRYYPRAQLLQALNPQDAARLGQMLGRPVEVRPLAVPMPKQPANPASAPPRALFLGDYSHQPNPQSALRLAQHVWPRVREQLPDAELILAGPRAGPAIIGLADRPGIRVAGYVDDLPALLRGVRLLLAPLYSGTGSRIKVLTALAHGLPVVSNNLGLRGIDAPSSAAPRAESDAELAAAATLLLRDPTAAETAGRAARTWAQANAGADAVAEAQLERFARLVNDAGTG